MLLQGMADPCLWGLPVEAEVETEHQLADPVLLHPTQWEGISRVLLEIAVGTSPHSRIRARLPRASRPWSGFRLRGTLAFALRLLPVAVVATPGWDHP